MRQICVGVSDLLPYLFGYLLTQYEYYNPNYVYFFRHSFIV